MKIVEILKKSKELLGAQGDLLGAEVLLAFVLDRGREFLLAHPDNVLTEVEEKQFWFLLRRFFAGEPVAYLTHRKEFFGLDFYVDERVLIPRPETEFLVQQVIDFLRDFSDLKSEPLRILDIGTGSGCIAVALAKHLSFAQITATDISTLALEVAHQNAEKHEVTSRINFLQSDLLDGVENDRDHYHDIIVANLPYIGRKRNNFISREAYDHEPHIALFGGDDGLLFYRKLFEQIGVLKRKPRLFLGEFGFLQHEEISRLLKTSLRPKRLEILPDYAKIERIFIAEF